MSDVSLGIGADNTELVAALAEAKKQVAEASKQMKESLESISQGFEKVNQAMIAVTAVLAGGKAFGEAIEASVGAAKGAASLGKALGITATQASILRVAMDENFVSQEAMTGASAKIANTLKKNENAFKELGVATRDSNGNFKNSFEIMQEVNAKLLTFKEGTDRNVEGMKIYGKSWGEIAPTLKITEKAMEEAKVTATSLGLVVGKEGIAQAAEYRKAMAGVHTVFDALQKVIGDAVVPVFTKLGEWFTENGPAAVAIMRASIYALYAAWTYLKEGVVIFTDYFIGSTELWVAALKLFANVADRAMHLDFVGAKQAWDEGTSDISAKAKQMANNIVRDMKDAAAARDEFLNSQDKQQTATEEKSGKASTGGDGKEKSRVSEWETELAEKKAHDAEMNAANGVFIEASKQQDVDYWKKILANASLTLEERKAIRQKVAADEVAIQKQAFEGELAALKTQEAAHKDNMTLRLALDQQYAEKVKTAYGAESKEYADAQKAILDTKRAAVEQQQKLDTIRLTTVRNQQVAAIDLEESAAKERYDLGATSLAQFIAQEQGFEERKYAIKRKAAEDELALAKLMNPDDPVKQAEINAQLEQLESLHQANLAKIRAQADAKAIALNKTFTNAFQSGMENAFKGIVNGTETVGKAFQKMYTGLLSTVVDSLAKMAAQWITQHLLQTALGKQEQATNASTAATGAGASAAAIPYVGWALAPIEMASVFASALGYKSAAGGYDIPAGLNPMTQLHAREMVLPAKQADVIRNLADQPPAQSQASSTHLHVAALDGHSVQKVLTRNASHVQKAMKKMNARFMK